MQLDHQPPPLIRCPTPQTHKHRHLKSLVVYRRLPADASLTNHTREPTAPTHPPRRSARYSRGRPALIQSQFLVS